MDFQDKNLICKDCGTEFIFTVGEQVFYKEKGLENEPQRCKTCRVSKKQARQSNREMYEVVCAECGSTCQVPFKPRSERPVYCSTCFQTKKTY